MLTQASNDDVDDDEYIHSCEYVYVCKYVCYMYMHVAINK